MDRARKIRTLQAGIAAAMVVAGIIGFLLVSQVGLRMPPTITPNWAGYAIQTSPGSVSDVRGSWIVPAIQGVCPSTNQFASFWVGIDGLGSATVEQTGTDSDCVNGVPTYIAWYEFFPAASHTRTPLQIHPGDVMSAEVLYSGGRFTVTITDLTTGNSFSTTKADNQALRVSAEWIAEAPSSASGVLPLADFGTVAFGSDHTGGAFACSATISGTTGNVGSFSSGLSIHSITMVTSSNTPKAVPSTLSSDGTSFTVTWASAGP